MIGFFPLSISIFYFVLPYHLIGLPWCPSSKEPAFNAGATRDVGLIPGSGRSPQGGAWQPTPAFLPGEANGLRSLVGCSL